MRSQTSIICCIQSMHMILTVFVALTLLPQQGHCSFLVLLGRLSPLLVPVWLVPVAPILIPGKPLFLPMRISFQSFESAYSINLSLGRVFHPYCPHLKHSRPRFSASALNRPL